MEQIISKEEFNELMKLKGQVRGIAFQGEAKFVLEKEGKEGLRKLERTMIELGFPYNNIKVMDFYSIGWVGVAMVVMKRLFGWNNKKFQEMGEFEAKSSLSIRLFMKYFLSLEKIKEEGDKMWNKYFTVGRFKVIEINKKKKYIIVRIEDFKFHPLSCQAIKGYFISILKMIVKSKTTCQETKCVHRGDEYHEFLVKW